MLSGLFTLLRKMTIGVLLVFSISCLAAVFGAQLPDQEVCLFIYNIQSSTSGYIIFDTTNGRYTAETRQVSPLSIRSPDAKKLIFLRPVPHDTDLYDLFLQTEEAPTKARLIQHAIYYASGSTQLLGDQLRWSRDSERVAFLWGNRDQDFFLTLLNVETNQFKTVTPFAKDPSKVFYTRLQEWSADDRYFSVIEQVLNDTHYTFWDTDTLTPVSYPLSSASMVRGVWSPNGHTFASIVRNDKQKPTHLMILNPEESDSVVQVPLLPNDIQHVMWSPNGSALVIGYLTCTGANCRQQWHYDLVQSNGVPLAIGLAGSIVNNTNISGNTTYAPDGRTSFSGYPFNAVWSSDGKRFVYLEQSTSGDNPTYAAAVFDMDKKQQLPQVAYPTANFSNSFFRTMQYTYVSSRIMEQIPTVPLSDYVIIPYLENDKISVMMTGGSLKKPITLVSKADQLISLPNPNMQGQYWGTDWHGNDHIIIEWSTGQGKDKRVKLTTADANGSNIQTVDDDLDAIPSMSFVNTEDRPMLGFVGKKGELNILYLFDLNSGKQIVVLEDIEDISGWEINFSPRQTMMAVRGSIIQPGGGQLYLRSEDSDTLTKVDADPRSRTIWSRDGEKIALISGDNTGSQDVLVASKDGKRIADYPISPNSLQNFFPMRWSKCY